MGRFEIVSIVIMRSPDTTSRAEEIHIEVFRRMKPAMRLQTAIDLAQTSRKLLEQGVYLRHPDYGKDQIRLAAIKLMLGEDLFQSAYPEAKDILT